MTPIRVPVTILVDAVEAAELAALYRDYGWGSLFHQVCRGALRRGQVVIDNAEVTRLGDEIVKRVDNTPPATGRSYDPHDVGSRFD